MNDDTFTSCCRALGHPIRLKIVQYLKSIDSCFCGDIVSLLPLAQSTVSQHLKCLKESGLIKGDVEGPCTCYCLDREKLEKFVYMANQLKPSE